MIAIELRNGTGGKEGEAWKEGTGKVDTNRLDIKKVCVVVGM